MSERTIYHRRRRMMKLQLWERIRSPYTWDDCPKCGAGRDSRQCACGYEGSQREFRRPPTFRLNVERIASWPRPKGVRPGSYRDYKNSPAYPGNKHPESDHRSIPPAAKPVAPQPTPIEQHSAVSSDRSSLRIERSIATDISARLRVAASLVIETCGLPDLEGLLPYVEAAILAESKFKGLEVPEAAKYLAECALRDQKHGVAIGRFYFRDAKWRNHAGTQSASSQRSERSKANILEALRRHREQQEGGRNPRGPDAPDGPERQE